MNPLLDHLIRFVWLPSIGIGAAMLLVREVRKLWHEMSEKETTGYER
jgi:hypothetical protein